MSLELTSASSLDRLRSRDDDHHVLPHQPRDAMLSLSMAMPLLRLPDRNPEPCSVLFEPTGDRRPR